MTLPVKSDIEGCAVISCADVSSEEIICNILHLDKLPEPHFTEENIKGYLWPIDTKYYTAEAYLYEIKDKVLFSPSLADKVRAMIFYFDSKEPSSFKDVLSWMPFMKELCTDVQLLVCSNCSEDGNVTASERKNILEWCLQNQFELVELEPIEESDDEMEEIFKETKGYSRIIQALHSHSWADMVLKDEPCHLSKKFLGRSNSEEIEENVQELSALEELSLKEDESTKEEVSACSNSHEIETKNDIQSSSSGISSTEDQQSKNSNVTDKISEEEQWLSDILSKDETNGQSFESMFNKFFDMRERASGLTGDDRKKYAEEVAIAFWRAIGGDEDEISGLDE